MRRTFAVRRVSDVVRARVLWNDAREPLEWAALQALDVRLSLFLSMCAWRLSRPRAFVYLALPIKERASTASSWSRISAELCRILPLRLLCLCSALLCLVAPRLCLGHLVSASLPPRLCLASISRSSRATSTHTTRKCTNIPFVGGVRRSSTQVLTRVTCDQCRPLCWKVGWCHQLSSDRLATTTQSCTRTVYMLVI